MTDKPSEAAIREVCRRTGFHEADVERMLKFPTDYPTTMLAASLIEKYEPDTLIDPYLKRAREIFADEAGKVNFKMTARLFRDGSYDRAFETLAIIRALKEGMPK